MEGTDKGLFDHMRPNTRNLGCIEFLETTHKTYYMV